MESADYDGVNEVERAEMVNVISKIGILAGVVGLCLSCGGRIPELETEAATVSIHYAKDGTRFKTARDTTDALPHHFPSYLILPESTILSSGQIQDRAGGVASLLLRTSLSKTELLDHYREGMWFRYWDLLSEITPEDSHLLTFEYTHPEASRYQQAVIQISSSSVHPDHEILILYSFDTPAEQWASYPDKSSPDQSTDSSAIARSTQDLLPLNRPSP